LTAPKKVVPFSCTGGVGSMCFGTGGVTNATRCAYISRIASSIYWVSFENMAYTHVEKGVVVRHAVF
jgi:hypothetical protein